MVAQAGMENWFLDSDLGYTVAEAEEQFASFGGGEHVAAKRPAATRTSSARRVNVEMRDFSREQGYVSSQGGS